MKQGIDSILKYPAMSQIGALTITAKNHFL